ELARELGAIESELPDEIHPAPGNVLVSDSEAQQISQRAAELQDGTSAQPRPLISPGSRSAAQPTSGYALADVRGAAREARIAARSIHPALAERGLATVGGSAIVPVVVSELTGKANRLAGGPLVIEYEA